MLKDIGDGSEEARAKGMTVPHLIDYKEKISDNDDDDDDNDGGGDETWDDNGDDDTVNMRDILSVMKSRQEGVANQKKAFKLTLQIGVPSAINGATLENPFKGERHLFLDAIWRWRATILSLKIAWTC